MSEPPQKKQRSMLEFYNPSERKPRRSPRKTPMASSTESLDSPAIPPTLPATIPIEDIEDEKPGTSKEDQMENLATGDSADFEDTEDSEGLVQDVPTKKPTQIQQGSCAWKGLPLDILDKVSNKDLGPLQQTESHNALFKLPYTFSENKPPRPYTSYKDRWDNHHVRMPCSNQNEYPAQAKDGSPVVRRRWDMIQEVLLGNIPGPYELEAEIKPICIKHTNYSILFDSRMEKILSYNSRYMGRWSFDVIHSFFIEHCEEEERNHFFNHTLKKIAHLALQLPHICTAPIPLLKNGQNRSITLSQQQIACLLANAFFCTFPRRNAKSKNSEYNRFPSINFNSLFTGQPSQVKFEKLRCIINYFRRVCDKMPTGTVTFSRQCLERFPNWDEDTTMISGLHVSSEGTIEDDGEGLFQVDFANMFLGGGVLGHGCVQEEIRFLICPEMIVSRLFTECLDKRECLIMRGCERFSNYDGYASKFVWKSNIIDKTERDSWGRIKCEVVAIDALVIRDYKAQFQPWMVKRELNKAFCGFYSVQKSTLPAVCTGNWGCGAFGGDKHLKALLQLMAASRAKRDLCYFTFDDEKLRDDLFSMHKLLTEKGLHIGDLMRLITNYYNDRIVFLWLFTTTPSEPLYDYLHKQIDKHKASFTYRDENLASDFVTRNKPLHTRHKNLTVYSGSQQTGHDHGARPKSRAQFGPVGHHAGNYSQYEHQLQGQNLDSCDQVSGRGGHQAKDVHGQDSSSDMKVSRKDSEHTKGDTKYEANSEIEGHHALNESKDNSASNETTRNLRGTNISNNQKHEKEAPGSKTFADVFPSTINTNPEAGENICRYRSMQDGQAPTRGYTLYNKQSSGVSLGDGGEAKPGIHGSQSYPGKQVTGRRHNRVQDNRWGGRRT